MTVLLAFCEDLEMELHIGPVVTVGHDTTEDISVHTQGCLGDFQSRPCMVGNAVNGFGNALFSAKPFQLLDIGEADKTIALVDFPIYPGRYEGIAAHDFGFKERVFALAYGRIVTFYIIEIRIKEQFQRHLVRDNLAELVADHTAVSVIPMSG